MPIIGSVTMLSMMLETPAGGAHRVRLLKGAGGLLEVE